MKDMMQPLVSIRCLTYNHAPYIRQCLDGFVMQKTNFKFEAIVHDDASTDGTADIVREYATKYPDIIKPILETENQYSKQDGSLKRIMNAAISPSAKYIAMCEGDDYWTDPYKLQKQVDFLESHPQYGFVGSLVSEQYGEVIKDAPNPIYLSDNFFEEDGRFLLCGNLFDYAKYGPLCRTATLVFRKSLYDVENSQGDFSLQAILAYKSFFALLLDRTCVYRIHKGGVSNNGNPNNRLSYTKWYVQQFKILNNLYPGIYSFKDYELSDKVAYAELQCAIWDLDFTRAKVAKKEIKGVETKRKIFFKFCIGPMSMICLHIMLKFKASRFLRRMGS